MCGRDSALAPGADSRTRRAGPGSPRYPHSRCSPPRHDAAARRPRALCAAAATYLSYTLFALMITYVFRYNYWTQAGFGKILQYIGIGGTIAAIGCAVFVPFAFRLGEQLKTMAAMPFRLRLQLAPGGISLVTTGLWVFSIAAYFLHS